MAASERRKPYDPHRPCPKCGHMFVTTRHVTFLFVGSDRDALRRTCDRCLFSWDEAPRDAPRVVS